MTLKYEFSVFNKEELIYNKEKLLELGRDVKYTPKKKQKPAADKKAGEGVKTEKIETKTAEEKTETKPGEESS